MEKIQTKEAFIFRRACDQRIPEKYKTTYEIADGVEATFAKRKNNGYDLCCLTFDREWFDFEDADMFWNDMQIRLVSKKADWNRKFPPLNFVMDVGNDLYVIGHYRNLEKTETLGKQYEEMEDVEGDIVDDWYDDYLLDEEFDDYDDGDDDEIPDYESLKGKELAKHPAIVQYDKKNQYISQFMEQYQQTDESVMPPLASRA